MRSIAILGVILSHSTGFLWPLAKLPSVGWFIGKILVAVSPLGILGVELFFVLSGFLIGGILIKIFMNADHFGFPEIKNFWIRRWFRTLPNYWLLLTINIVLYKAMHQGGHTGIKILYYVFLQNLWYPHLLSFFGEAWSLSVEEWFYLTLPLFLYLCYRVMKPNNKKAFLLKAFVIYLLLFVSGRFINAFHPINGLDQDAGIRKVVVFRLDAVMFGVFFAYFNHFKPEVLSKIKNYLLFIGVTGTTFIYFLLTDTQFSVVNSSNPQVRLLSNAFLYLLIPLVFSLFLPAANAFKTIRNNWLAAATTHISKISYSLYLVNYSLVYTLFFYPLKLESNWAIIGLYILYWVIILILSSLLYRFFEYPVMQLRDRYSR